MTMALYEEMVRMYWRRRLLIIGGLVCAVTAPSACAQNALRSSGPEEDISYSYRLTTNRDPKLCKHMNEVLNNRFRKLWIREPLPLTAGSSTYSPEGKFAFARLSGVEHDKAKTFEMALSKLPSSPEFDAIGWKETRITLGGPPGVQIPERDTPLAALVAYFDFDNDGQKDTVIKHGFTRGYEATRDRAESPEYLAVWRSKAEEVPPDAPLWALEKDATGAARAITENGQYLRPFMYGDRAYVAKYEMHFSDFEFGKLGPYEISKETMTILDLRDTGAHVELTRMPAWTGTTVCQYEMIQTN